MTRALVIDDDERIIEHVQERLTSMDHECDTALCQEQAEKLLKGNVYDYILLDLEIPMRFQKPADKEYGKNLLHKIKRMPGHKDRPVIIITAHCNGYHDAVEMMKEGAADFVGKPFGEKHPLEKKIREVLEKYPPSDAGEQPAKKNSKKGPPAIFEGGYLDFYPDRIELCGVRVCGAKNSSQKRKILDLLRDKTIAGEKRNYDQHYIAEKLKILRGQQAVGESVMEIRKACADRLLEDKNIKCADKDVIINNGQGYHFSDKIKIRDGGVDASTHEKFTGNQLAILRELRAKPSLSRKVVGDRLSLTVEVLEREMDSLIRQKFVKRIGSGAATRYHLVNDPQ